MCQGATAATRAAAFPADDDLLDLQAVEILPRLRTRLGPRDTALAAPARAAQDTAAALATTVVVEPALRDCDYGTWTGATMAEIAAAEPDGLARWLGDPHAAPHGGDALAAVIDRAREWLAQRAAMPGRCLAVTAPTMVRALVLAALDLPLPVFWRLDVAPLTITRLTAQQGRWRLAAFAAPP